MDCSFLVSGLFSSPWGNTRHERLHRDSTEIKMAPGRTANCQMDFSFRKTTIDCQPTWKWPGEPLSPPAPEPAPRPEGERPAKALTEWLNGDLCDWDRHAGVIIQGGF